MDNYNDILQRQYEFINNRSDDEKDIINQYTGDLYLRLNENLRDGYPLSKREQYAIDVLDSLFDKIKKINEPIKVYRGGNYIPKDIKAYISTSLSIDIAIEQFLTLGQNKEICCLMEILISPGSKVLPIENISQSRHEREILLPRYGTFIHTNTIYMVYKKYSIKTYQLTYVPTDISIDVPPQLTEVIPIIEEVSNPINLDRVKNLLDDELIRELKDVGYNDEDIYDYLLIQVNDIPDKLRVDILNYIHAI